MIQSVRFEVRHLEEIEPRDYDRMFLGEFRDLEVLGHALADGGPAVSFLGDGGVLGAAGILRLQRGVGEAWLTLSAAFPAARPNRRWAELTQLLNEELTRQMPDPFHRLQTAIPNGFAPGHRFAGRLGFEPEGIMRRYGPDGSDFQRFARTV